MGSDMEKKLVVCDLDGSLLKDDETISDYTVDIIKKFVEKGNKFCIATGRPIGAAIKYYEQLGLNTVMANLNGGLLTNPSDSDFLPINSTFSKDSVHYIFSDKFLLKYVGCAFVFAESTKKTFLFTNDEKEFFKWEFISKFHIGSKEDLVTLKLNQFDQITRDVNSILIYVKDKSSIDDISFRIKGIANTLIVRSWSPSTDFVGIVIEILPIFSSKSTVTKFLSSYYMIPLSKTYSFGDGENDVDMLLKSNGYAMKNASYTVKLMTNRITTYTNDNDGVARQMQKIFRL